MKHLYIILAILFIIVLLLVGFRKDKPYIIMDHVVQSGDTLDGLYYQYADSSVSLLKWRYEVKRLNGMTESGIFEGDVVRVWGRCDLN